MNSKNMHTKTHRSLRSLAKAAVTGIAAVTLALGMGATAAWAASITGHDVSQTDGVTTISVTGPAENAGSEASVLIMNTDGDLTQPDAQDVVWIGQVTLDDAGAGSASFRVEGNDLCAYAIALNTNNGGDRYLAPLGSVGACGELGGGDTPGDGGDDGNDDGNNDGGDNGEGDGDGNSENPGAGDGDNGASNTSGDTSATGDDSNSADGDASGLALTGSTLAPILVAVAAILLLLGALLFVIRHKRSNSNQASIIDNES